MRTLTTARELDDLERPLVLVPTMGALHEGHASLVRFGASIARERALPGGCIVSIFVNPTQFTEQSDFARYPRTPEEDAEMCRAAGAAAVVSPSVAEMYPEGAPVRVPALPPVATRPGLEDAQRPGHFAGVCQVVLRLFELVRPAVAVFGEKDWQQLQVISAMTAWETPGIEIVGAPTVRERDGLAMSSRNRFLSPSDRARALALSRALTESVRHDDPEQAEHAMRRRLAAEAIEPDYAVVREAASLLPVASGSTRGRCRALIAARVGSVRLLDNASWPG